MARLNPPKGMSRTQHVVEVYRANDRDTAKTASVLGVSETTVYYHLDKANIARPDWPRPISLSDDEVRRLDDLLIGQRKGVAYTANALGYGRNQLSRWLQRNGYTVTNEYPFVWSKGGESVDAKTTA